MNRGRQTVVMVWSQSVTTSIWQLENLRCQDNLKGPLSQIAMTTQTKTHSKVPTRILNALYRQVQKRASWFCFLSQKIWKSLSKEAELDPNSMLFGLKWNIRQQLSATVKEQHKRYPRFFQSIMLCSKKFITMHAQPYFNSGTEKCQKL